MRILAVHLRNLNSLAGSWSIDFTAGEYTASGIFAITGPTGAGKSTLLDAICLALFGRTPRLGSITKGSNEIMSRRAGDCFAEVSFSTNNGQYRCHWGQHRARRKASGELQTPRHEIVELTTGKVLENRSREVVRMVEQVTGMDYDRFTRSILLAQGDFAAFLDADADQRAPILEQITGTAIYSQLSQATHERTSEERKKTAVLEEGLRTLKLLSPEEEQDIGKAIEEAGKAAEHLRVQQEQAETTLQKLARIEALKQQLHETQNRLTQLAEQKKLAEPDLYRLELGLRAQSLVPLHSTLGQLQTRIRILEHKAQERSKHLQQLQQTLQEQHKEHLLARKLQEESQATRERELERIKKVRALDLQLHEHGKTGQQLNQKISHLHKAVTSGKEEQQKLSQQLAGLRQGLKKLRRFQAEHAVDALLVEQFAGLQQQLLHLGQKAGERQQLRQVATQAKQQLVQLDDRQQQLDQNVEQRLQALSLHKQEQQQLLQQRAELLDAHTVGELRQELSNQEGRQQQLERAEEWAVQLHASRESVLRLQGLGKAILEQQQRVQEQLQPLEKQLMLGQQLVEQCEKNQQLSLRIRSYEEERSRLEEGVPCPLCGALDHPWRLEHPQTDGQEGELVRARTELEQSRMEMSRLRETLAVLARDLEHNRQRQTEQQQQIEALSQQLAALLDSYQLGPLATCTSALAAALDKTLQQTVSLRTRLTAHDQLESRLEALNEKIEQASALHQQDIQQAQANRQALATKEIERKTLTTRVEETEAWLNKTRQELQPQLQPFDSSEIMPQRVPELIKSLASRLQQWKTVAMQEEKLNRQEGQMITTLEKQEVHIANLESQLHSQMEEQAALKLQQATLRQQRTELYGELNPDVEEQRLRSLVQQAEKRETSAREQLATTEKERHSLNAQERLDQEELATLRPERSAQEAQLLTEVRKAGFENPEAFAAAILPPETLQQLAERKQQLEQHEVHLASRKEELGASIREEEADLDRTKTKPKLLAAKESLQAQREELLQRIGADRQRLAANQRLAQECELQRQRLAEQQEELRRWELLHQLIGSADGKKFRVFAQGLTFEVMVSHANRQLRKMSDRYLLLRDPGEPLSLQVIDNYQAGEVRSTRNLSGGESFLVSLALSLGLSAMASHNVRVDSLFLDEGFGTLDEETLDTALQTLAELQQDGKLIGIISHVPLLKERIDLRIQVQPGPDGCSHLLGPGCRQLD